jgi:hypothetical protein
VRFFSKMYHQNALMTRKNLFLIVSFSFGFLAASSLGFASGTASNLWVFSKHVEAGGELTITATMLDINHPPSDYNPSTPGGDDDHGYELDLTAPAQLVFNTGYGWTNGIKFTAGYYRGPIYAAHSLRSPFIGAKTNSSSFVSIFSKRDKSELIVAVDHGPIYTSTNSGMTWKVITAPGVHKFPLCTAPDGGGIYARVPIDRPRSSPATTAPTNPADWYAVASSADGSKLVVTASSSQPAPALNIRYSATGVTIVWPGQFTSFVLEHNTDLDGGIWTAITNSVQLIEGENHVVVSPEIGNQFFRLRGR